ncbi:unnamed protein product [Cochlearia groenlandica]
MIEITHLSSVNSLDKVSGAKEMITMHKGASTKHMAKQSSKGVKAYFKGYEIQSRRRVSNYLLIKEDLPNSPPPQRDKFLNTYLMKSTNFLCIGVGYTLSWFDTNSYISRTTPTIFLTLEGALTALDKPYTRSDLI